MQADIHQKLIAKKNYVDFLPASLYKCRTLVQKFYNPQIQPVEKNQMCFCHCMHSFKLNKRPSV